MFSTYAHQNVRCPCCRHDILLQVFDEPWNRHKRFVFRHPSNRRQLAGNFDYESVSPALELTVKLGEYDLLPYSGAIRAVEELIERARHEIADRCSKETKTVKLDLYREARQTDDVEQAPADSKPNEIQRKAPKRRIIL